MELRTFVDVFCEVWDKLSARRCAVHGMFGGRREVIVDIVIGERAPSFLVEGVVVRIRCRRVCFSCLCALADYIEIVF